MRNRILGVLKNRFVTNTGWILAERIFQMIVSLVVGMLTARYLGPSNYGVINYVAAFISFATPVCTLGLEGLLVKRFVNQPDNTGKIVGTTIFMEFVTSIVATLVICGIVYTSNAHDSIKTIVALLESVKLWFKSTEVIGYWYQSQLKSKITSIAAMIGYICMSVYRIILLYTRQSVVWFGFATSLDMIVIAVLYLLLFFRNSNHKITVDLKYGRDMLKESYHFILSGLMVVLYSQMDKIMIQSMLGDTDVGLYSAAYAICNLWFFIPAALITSAQPIIMRKKTENESVYLLRLKQLYAGVFWLGIFVGLIVTVCSKLIISILYGEAYLSASGCLIIGIWYGTFAQLGNARGVWVLCEQKNKYIKYYVSIGAILNLILNWIFIRIWGINGAALATLITQFFVCFVAPLFFSETRVHTSILCDGISLRWFFSDKKGCRKED